MAGSAGSYSSEGVVSIRHPRALDLPQDAWMDVAREDALGRLYGYHSATQSFRTPISNTCKSKLQYQADSFFGSTIIPLPQVPFTTAQWPAVSIHSTRLAARNQQVRLTTLNDGYITANLVAPSFDAVWLCAIEQLSNSIRQCYVQQLTLSPGLGKGWSGGGKLPDPVAFDATAFSWSIDAQRMGRGKIWPSLSVQKSSAALLDVPKVLAAIIAQGASFVLPNTQVYRKPHSYYSYNDIGAWIFPIVNQTFDPLRMSPNTVISDVRSGGRKWWTSDPVELSWLIPNALYSENLFNSQGAQSQSFRTPSINRNWQRQQTYIEEGWVFPAVPPFNPIQFPWNIPAERSRIVTNTLNRLQRQYDYDNAWNVFRPEVMNWMNRDGTFPRTYNRDDRQRYYAPDNAWNTFDPKLIDWVNHDSIPNLRAIYRDLNRQLSDVQLTGWLVHNVPPVDPTTYLAILQLLLSFKMEDRYKNIRGLTEMVQLSWLSTPLHLPALDIILPPVPADPDPHFTSSPTVTPYWMVYPHRSRHRRFH